MFFICGSPFVCPTYGTKKKDKPHISDLDHLTHHNDFPHLSSKQLQGFETGLWLPDGNSTRWEIPHKIRSEMVGSPLLSEWKRPALSPCLARLANIEALSAGALPERTRQSAEWKWCFRKSPNLVKCGQILVYSVQVVGKKKGNVNMLGGIIHELFNPK